MLPHKFWRPKFIRKFQLTGGFGLTNGSREPPHAVLADRFRGYTVVKPELGNKHHCQQCGTKFFDLNRSPVVCPKCGAVQQVASTRAVRASAPEKEEALADTGVELVSLDEVEPAEPDLETVADDDVEIEDEPADDTFLEEEEEDTDDVSGLIDGEIAPDEER